MGRRGECLSSFGEEAVAAGAFGASVCTACQMFCISECKSDGLLTVQLFCVLSAEADAKVGQTHDKGVVQIMYDGSRGVPGMRLYVGHVHTNAC